MTLVDLNDISTEERGTTFDKFKLDPQDKARIYIPTTNLAQHWVHVFHNDEPEMKDMGGWQKPEWDKGSYKGKYICLGDFKTVNANPKIGDPDNCPACKFMAESDARLIETPRMAYAMNVIRYATRHRENTPPLRNLNVQVQVWQHGDKKKLIPLKTVLAEGVKITEVDFLVSADDSDGWGKLNISPSTGGSLYAKNEEIKENIDKAVAEDLYPSEVLTEACGTTTSADQMEREINQLVREYKHGSGSGKTAAGASSAAAVNELADDSSSADDVVAVADDAEVAELLEQISLD